MCVHPQKQKQKTKQNKTKQKKVGHKVYHFYIGGLQNNDAQVTNRYMKSFKLIFTILKYGSILSPPHTLLQIQRKRWL